MATPAQVEANRRNAQQSTGPKTDEGKARSRRNALKHGLAARQLLPEQDEAAVLAREGRLAEAFQPADAWEAELVGRIAADTHRAERCALEDSAVRALAARRAELCWDDERALDAEVLGKALAKRPAETKALLERTPQGCAWLAARWGDLARLVEAGATPEADRRSLACDLLGLPESRRPASGALGPDGDDLAELARSEVDRLEARAARLADLDETERELAESGIGPAIEKAVRAIRRYESACLRRVEWALAQLRKHRGSPDSGPRGRPEPSDRPGRAPTTPPRPEARTNPIAPPRAEARTNPIPASPAPARTNPIASQSLHVSILPKPPAPYRSSLASALDPLPGNRRDRRAARRAG